MGSSQIHPLKYVQEILETFHQMFIRLKHKYMSLKLNIYHESQRVSGPAQKHVKRTKNNGTLNISVLAHTAK